MAMLMRAPLRLVGLAVLVGGCMQSTLEVASDVNMT
jgi:hypothetical protein